MLKKQQTIPQDVTKKEMFHYSMLGVAECVVFCLWNNYMLMFYTDVFLLPPIFVSGLFLVSRIWDGINDPLLGIVAERTKTRWGRFKNYMLFMPLLLGIVTVLNFTVPNLKGIAAMVYAAITYVLMGMVYTTVDVSFFSLPTVMTTDNKKRTTLFGLSRLSTGMATTVFAMLIIPSVQFFGKGNMAKGFFITAIIYSAISCCLYLLNAPNIHERIMPPKNSLNFKKTCKALFGNKPLLMIMVLGFIVQISAVAKSSMNIYYVTYNLNNINLMPLLGLVSIPGMLLGAIIAPTLMKKFEKKYVAIGLNMLCFLSCLLFFFVGNNMFVLLFQNFIFIFYVGAIMVLISVMTADTIEYAEWKTGQRNEGFITSTQTFISKMAVAISGASIAGLLALVNYVPNTVQTPQTLEKFFLVISIFPGILALLAIIPMIFYKLSQNEYSRIVEEINHRKENDNQDIKD